MASSATIINFEITANGTVNVEYSDGSVKEWRDLASIHSRLDEMDSDDNFTKALALAYWRARSPDFSNFNLVRDKAIVFDLTNNNPIRLDPNSQATGIMAQAR